MAEEDVEPTNEQLARFLIVYSKRVPGAENLQLSAPVLESLMSQNPRYREMALRRHRKFVEEASKGLMMMAEGKLQCAHIRPNGKNCPNFNEPGSFYCGLHKDED